MGPTEDGLNRAFQRYAVWVRVLVVVPCVVLGLLGTPEPYRATALLVGLGTLAWCALSLWWLRRTPGVWLVVAVAIAGVLAIELTQYWTAPGLFNGWAFAVASITTISIQYELATRPVPALLVSLVTAAAYVAGASMARPLPDAALLGLRLLGETALSRGAYLLISSRARAADRANARAAEERRTTEIAAARRAAEREHLATLHDTASATLLMVSLGLGGTRHDWLTERAGQDLEAVAAAPRRHEGTVDLADLLTHAVRHPSVTVELRLPDTMPLPARPALAISHGVREAVENVARHAGVPTATLTAQAGAGAVTVELADDGRGFDPARVGDHRRGLADSITGRMTALGGDAELRSAPGEGTTVRWRWHD